MFGFSDRYRVEGTIRRLNELGFAVDEVSLQPVSDDPSRLKIRVAVGDRRYHAQRLRELTGLDVGEGQARILLGDLRAYQAQLCREAGHDVDESTAARLWVMEVLTPYEQLAHDVVGHHTGTAIQAYCDLLEVRWLLSEQAGHDVGTNRRSRRWPEMSSPPTPPRRWPSPRCRRRRCRSQNSTTRCADN